MNRKHFVRMLLTLGLPISLQHLVISSLNFIDTIMIGRLGGLEIAAVGLANQIYFIVNIFIFGVCSGTAVFTAQFWGSRNVSALNRTTALGLILGTGPIALVFLVSFLRPESVMGLFTNDPALRSMAAGYLRIVSFSYLFNWGAHYFEHIVKSTEQVRYPLYVAIVAFGVNTLLNLVLIFGYLGFPALGIAGAALATVISRVLEFGLITAIVYGRRLPGAVRLSDFLERDRAFVNKFVRVATPVVVNELTWVFGISVYMVVFGRMGPQAVAVVTITQTVERILISLMLGVGGAASIMLGNSLGARRIEETRINALRILHVAGLLGATLGIAVSLLAPVFVAPFNIDGETARLSIVTMRLMGFSLVFKSVNIALISGVLRSGADTTYTFLMDFAGVWLIAIPLGGLGALVFGLPVHWVYALFFVEEIVKSMVGYVRTVSGKWMNVLS